MFPLYRASFRAIPRVSTRVLCAANKANTYRSIFSGHRAQFQAGSTNKALEPDENHVPLNPKGEVSELNNYVFGSPGKYIQGSGALGDLGRYVAAIGHYPLVVVDGIVWESYEGRLVKSFASVDLSHHKEIFGGEASEHEIKRLVDIARTVKTDVVVGVGGGKTIDTVKAVADELKQLVVVAPTLASTDAPCSAISVIYDENGAFAKYRFYDRNPDMVIVDTWLCANAPARFFASGMADGLATFIEADSVVRGHANSMMGWRPTIAGLAIARACQDTLFTHGLSALRAVEKKIVTPAVEAVVEANTLLSGLGFENGGLSAAHAIHDGFTAVPGDIHTLTHGEKVAYGTLCQLVLEQRPYEEFARFVRFYRAIKMPTTLEDLHLENASWESLLKIGTLACSESDTLHNLDPRITPTQVANAIKGVDAMSTSIV